MASGPQTCPTCGKELSAGLADGARVKERAGSLTSFLLSDLSCTCRISGGDQKPSKLCPRCNKVIPDINRVGSLTAFFFKDLRCRCSDTNERSRRADMQTRLSDRQMKITRKRAALRETAMARTKLALSRDAAAFVDLSPGQVIGGSYKLVALAGQGGMGSVYQAQHIALSRRCAVKFIAPSMVSDETWRLFKKEAQIISSLTHPTICQVYDLGIHEGSLPFYVMDFVSGTTLDALITRQGTLSVGAVAELYIKVLEGLSYAHRRGIVHKDIKPANIMLERQNDGDMQVRILDFGISELSESAVGKQSDHNQDDIIGSAAYMSPEQFVSKRVDKTSDIYSLGCSIFETLAGLPPFTGSNFEALERAHTSQSPPTLSGATGLVFPAQIESIVAKCLEKDARQRYQNASEVSIDLQKMLEGKPLQFARESASVGESGTRSGEARSAALRRLAFLVTSVIVVGAAFVALAFWATATLTSHINVVPIKTKINKDDGNPWLSLAGRAGDSTAAAGAAPEEKSSQAAHNDNVSVESLAMGEKYFAANSEQDVTLYKTSPMGQQYVMIEPPKPGERIALNWDQLLLIRINRDGDHSAIFKSLQGVERVGADISELTDTDKELEQLRKYFPGLITLFMPLRDEPTKDFLSGFSGLRNLSFCIGAGGCKTLTLSDSITSVRLEKVNGMTFKPGTKGARPVVKAVNFQNSTITAEMLESLVKSIDTRAVTFFDCDVKKGALMGFRDTDKVINVEVFSSDNDFEMKHLDSLVALAGKVHVTTK